MEQPAGAEQPSPRPAAAGAAAPPAQETVVTATRLPRPLRDVPATVIVLPREELERNASATVDGVLRSLPSFATFRRTSSLVSDPTAQGVNLRGLGPSGVSRALVLLDGAPVNDAFGGWVYWRALPRLGLERVEVAPGAGSALYGSSALGGVVQLFTAPPRRASLEADASYGTLGTLLLGARGAQRVGDVGVALEAEGLRSDGHPVVAPLQRGPVDADAPSRHGTFDARAEWAARPGLRLTARAGGFGEEQSGGTQYTGAGVRLWRGALGAELEAGGAGALSLSLYGDSGRFRQTRARVAADRGTEARAAQQEVPAGQVGALALWTGRPLAGGHTPSAGVDLRRAEGTAREWLSPPVVRADSVLRREAGGTQLFAGAFVQDVWAPAEAVELVAGLRLDAWRNADGRRVLERADGTREEEAFAARWERALSPRLGARWRVHERLTLRASGAGAFRAPTLNELYRPFQVGAVLTAASADLRAERAWTAEAGAEVELAPAVTLRAAAFGARLLSPVVNATLEAPLPDGSQRQRRNLGAARVAGVEATLEARLARRWVALAGYTLADARVTDGGGQGEVEGKLLAQAPVHRGTVGLAFVDPALLTANVQARWVGPQFEDDLNTLPMAGFAVLDVFLARAVAGGVEVFAAAENLFDRTYLVGRAGVDTVGAPRTLRAGVRLRR